MSNAIAKAQPAAGWITTIQTPRFSEQVRKLLPAHVTPEKFVRMAMSAAMRNPDLAKCEPASVFNALMRLAPLGIELDSLGSAYLLPHWSSKKNCFEATLIVGYRGLVEMALRSGMLASIGAYPVHTCDAFRWDTGQVSHQVDFSRPRGDLYAVYAMAVHKDGTRQFEVMSKAEVDAIRKRSRAGQSGPWVSDYNAMAMKSAVRRLCKFLLLSPSFRDALEADEDERVTVDTSSTPEADPEPAAEEPALLAESADVPPAPVPAPAPEPARAPVPAPPPPAPRMEGQAEEHQSVKGVLIEAVAEKHGEKNGRAWTRWTVTFSGGLTAATFSDTDGHMAANLHRQKKPADLAVRPGRNGLDLVSICPADEIPM